MAGTIDLLVAPGSFHEAARHLHAFAVEVVIVCGPDAAERSKPRRSGAIAWKPFSNEERDLVAPKISRVRPPMEQEHRPTAALVLHMKRNAVDL